jgi:hypothetical protein
VNSDEAWQLESARKRTINAIWEYNNALGVIKDNDSFTIDLASVFVELKSGDEPVSVKKWLAAIGERQTTFYRLNRLNKRHYLLNLLEKLNGLYIPIRVKRLEAILMDFKWHVERQQRSMFRIRPSRREEIGRQLLLAYLPQRGYKEVPTGSGKMDIASFEKDSVKHVIETKVWYSRQYYLDGLDELIEYLGTEQLDLGYYVVFAEKLGRSGAVIKDVPSEDCHWESRKEKKIFVVIIDISLVPPSKKGRIERKGKEARVENG